MIQRTVYRLLIHIHIFGHNLCIVYHGFLLLTYLLFSVCTQSFKMPRRARVCVGHRRRREQQRNYNRVRQQVEAHAAQENNDAPVDAAINELNDLQLQHPEANDPLAMEAEQPIFPEADSVIEEQHIQLPAPHHLGGMNNRCPHCGARYFQKDCTTQHIFTKCYFQGKVSLPPIQLPSQNIVELFSGNTAESRHFLENI